MYNPLQYSCLENIMGRGAWETAVHGVAEGRAWLSDFTFTFHFHALEKEMATHSSVLAWRIPGTGEPGGLPSMGLHRVGHNWIDLAAVLPGNSHGRRSLVGCSPRGRTESDTTERLHFHFSLSCIGEGNGNPLQYSCLKNPWDREAWRATVHGVAESWTQLNEHKEICFP